MTLNGQSTQDPAQFRAYVHFKHEVALAVRGLTERLRRRGNQTAANECHELMVKLAEDRFTLAVVGQFKRGKSSLMNAIIGRELLPTGLLPLTSAITILRFGPRERLVIPREGFSIDEEAAISALREYVTEEGNPGNRKNIRAVYVEVPAPFLRRGLEFVDTPGIGSSIEANTATTMDFIPQCDAVLFVTSVESALSATESEFLRSVRRHVRKIFFVINKMDLLAEDQRAGVIDFVTEKLEQIAGAEQVRIFGVSSRLALAAKLKTEAREANDGGLHDLERALADFLTGEKSQTFLSAILDKVLRLAAHESGDLQLQGHLISSPNASVEQRLAWLRESIASENEPPQPDTDRNVASNNLIRNIPARICPVCAFLRSRMFDFFSGWQYALATDEHVQAQFAADAGFCPFHTWQLAAVASPLGLSNGYPKLARQVSAGLDSAARDSAQSIDLLRSLTIHGRTCEACRVHREAEELYIHRLLEWLDSPAARGAYSQAAGACLPHLRLLLSANPAEELVRLLLGTATRRFDELSDDMQGYAMKRDAIRRHLLNDNEEKAYLQTLALVAGDRYLSVATDLSQAEIA